MSEPTPISNEELEVLNCLTEAWNRFVHLAPAHPDELAEFRFKIHDLQRMVLARPQIGGGAGFVRSGST